MGTPRYTTADIAAKARALNAALDAWEAASSAGYDAPTLHHWRVCHALAKTDYDAALEIFEAQKAA